MTDHVQSLFDHPILNSPYECPRRHWELSSTGQPTQQTIETRRKPEFITPIPKPKKRNGTDRQQDDPEHHDTVKQGRILNQIQP